MGIFRLGKRFGWCNPRRVSESQKPRPLEIRGQECLFVMKQSTGRRCFGFFELVWNAWRVPHSALETSQRNSSSFFPQDIGWRYQDSEGLEVAISSDSDSRTAMLESWPSDCCQDINGASANVSNFPSNRHNKCKWWKAFFSCLTAAMSCKYFFMIQKPCNN